MNTVNLYRNVFILLYEGDEENDPPPQQGGDNQTFTQAQVNTLLAENKRALRESNKALLAELETLRENKSLTDQEKESLNSRIDKLKAETTSKIELEKERAKKFESDLEKTRRESEKSVQAWQNRFFDQMINTSILSAASTHGAYNANQILKQIKGDTQVVQKRDESGKEMEEFEVVVNFSHLNSEGQPIVLQLPPAKALEKMKEDRANFGNLFKYDGKTGLDMKPGPTSQSVDLAKMSPKEYQGYRRKQKQ